MGTIRFEAGRADALAAAARAHPGVAFNLNFADPDGAPLARCLRDVLLRAGWSQLSEISPAPGFDRRGIVIWAPPGRIAVADDLAAALRRTFPVQIIERHDGGPVALTVGLASWEKARGIEEVDAPD